MPAEISSNRFQTLPFEQAVISGFTQRVSKRTGYLEDEYIISRRACRSEIELINFGNLRGVDPIEALGDRGLIRKMSSTYIFSL